MFDSTFSYNSATPLPPLIDTETALTLLHDLETIIKLNPDIRGAKEITPKTKPKLLSIPASQSPKPGDELVGDVHYFEIEADLPFIPTRLWAGGVSYQADVVACKRGCDITIHAPGGFTSINHWRLVCEESLADKQRDELELPGAGAADVAGVNSEEAEDQLATGWSVQIVSDAKCNMTFAGFVKGFLKNSHAQLQQAFINKCIETKGAGRSTAGLTD